MIRTVLICVVALSLPLAGCKGKKETKQAPGTAGVQENGAQVNVTGAAGNTVNVSAGKNGITVKTTGAGGTTTATVGKNGVAVKTAGGTSATEIKTGTTVKTGKAGATVKTDDGKTKTTVKTGKAGTTVKTGGVKIKVGKDGVSVGGIDIK